MEQPHVTSARPPQPGQLEPDTLGPTYAGGMGRGKSPAQLRTASAKAAAAAPLQGWARSQERPVVVLDPYGSFGSFEPIRLRVDGDHVLDPLAWGPMPTRGHAGEWSE